MVLQQVFSPKSIILDLQSTEKDELFEEMLEAVVAVQPDIDRSEALHALRERESKMSTGIMHSVAVPHCCIDTAQGVVWAIGISRAGIDYASLDGAPVHYVFMLVGNAGDNAQHLKVLKSLASVLQQPHFIEDLLQKKSAVDVYALLCECEGSALN